jgi:tubulin polyglutamylase TTLL6/13
LTKPYLIDNLKFDIRLYVMLAGINPMRILLYNEGLARFATEPYVNPTADNIGNLFIHLTNYAINKTNENFVYNETEENDDVGHKRSWKYVLKFLKE